MGISYVAAADVHKLSLLVRKLAAGISLVPYIEPMNRSAQAKGFGCDRCEHKRDLSDPTLGLLQLLNGPECCGVDLAPLDYRKKQHN